MFAGRDRELQRLQQHLVQTAAGEPTNFMITGERGIGKSSLMLYVSALASGSVTIGGGVCKFLVLDIDIDTKTTQTGLIKKVELATHQKLDKTEPARAILTKTWEFLQRVKTGPFSIQGAEVETDETLVEEFSYSLARLAERICDNAKAATDFGAKYDGIMILIDEADNASASLDVGAFVKLVMERLQRHGCDRLMLGLAGLPHLREVLRKSHPSALRLFEEMSLERLNKGEINRVIDVCLTHSNRVNATATTIDQEARDLLATLSEGYPHFIQQFGFSAFAADRDDEISKEDVFNGALGAGGGLAAIGERYYRDDFYNKIQKDNYRQVLRIMADRLDDWVTKGHIRTLYKGSPSTLDNAIKALKDRNIIVPKEGVKGVYRLQNKGFALWMKLYTSTPDELQGAGTSK